MLEEELQHHIDSISPTKPARPYAFIWGQGLWNALSYSDSLSWIDQLQGTIGQQRPYLNSPGAMWPRLFLTPNAAGPGKPKKLRMDQGNEALMNFEYVMAAELPKRGVDFLGTWNMSVQMPSHDGT
jgi:hypothetical protein